MVALRLVEDLVVLRHPRDDQLLPVVRGSAHLGRVLGIPKKKINVLVYDVVLRCVSFVPDAVDVCVSLSPAVDRVGDLAEADDL